MHVFIFIVKDRGYYILQQRNNLPSYSPKAFTAASSIWQYDIVPYHSIHDTIIPKRYIWCGTIPYRRARRYPPRTVIRHTNAKTGATRSSKHTAVLIVAYFDYELVRMSIHPRYGTILQVFCFDGPAKVHTCSGNHSYFGLRRLYRSASCLSLLLYKYETDGVEACSVKRFLVAWISNLVTKVSKNIAIVLVVGKMHTR